MESQDEESKELEKQIKPILELLVYSIIKDKPKNIGIQHYKRQAKKYSKIKYIKNSQYI